MQAIGEPDTTGIDYFQGKTNISSILFTASPRDEKPIVVTLGLASLAPQLSFLRLS